MLVVKFRRWRRVAARAATTKQRFRAEIFFSKGVPIIDKGKATRDDER